MGASTQAMQQDLDEVALGSSAQAVEHVDEVKAPITLYYVVITAKPKRDGARLERASGFRIGEKAAMIAIDPLTQPAAAVQAALAMRSRCAR